MTTYNKKYSVGSISLAEPYFDYVHTLPLVTFSDVKNTVELALVYNSRICNQNHFTIANGYKINLQKKIVETSAGMSLLDSSGLIIKCSPATNQTASSATVYALNDDSHRILRRITSGFELEYPDYSKEYFDSEGKQTSSFDKYGEEIFRFEYNNINRLSSIIYRPEVSTSYKVLSFTYNSYNRLSTIKYIANGTTLTVGTFVYSNTGFTIQHYSGVDYVFSRDATNSVYSVYSTSRGGTPDDIYSQSYSCTKTTSTLNIIAATNRTVVDRMMYNLLCSEGENSNEIKMMETTNFHGVKTRIQYKNHKPHCSYEVFDDDNDMFINGSSYVGNIVVKDENGFDGEITFATAHYPMIFNDESWERFWYCDFGQNVDTTITESEIAITGWIKSTEQHVTTAYDYDREYQLEVGPVWKFFIIPVKISGNSVDIIFGDETLSFKDFKLVLLDKNLCKTRTLYNTVDLGDAFVSNVSGIASEIPEDKKYKASAADIMRYCLNVQRNHHANEFCYNDGRNLIVSSEALYLYDSNGTQTLLSIGNPIFSEQIMDGGSLVEKISIATGTSNLTKERYSSTGSYRTTCKYNQYFDLIQEDASFDGTENNKATKYVTYNSNHQIKTESIENMTKTYFYDNDALSTTLVYDTDEFGTNTIYTTDPIWGVVTQAKVSSIAQTDNTYTSDGTDLTISKFGGGLTQNDIDYSNGNVASMSSGGISYGFAYSNNDLTSVTKNNVLLKSFSYADDYKTVAATTPTSSSASFVTKKTTDKYGRTTGLYKTTTATEPDLVKNTYALHPYYDEETEEHLDFGDGKGANSLKTSTDFVSNKVKEYTYRGSQVDKIVTKQNDTQIDEEYYEYDNAGRMTKSVFKPSSNQSIETHLTYDTPINAWNTDSSINTFQNVVSGVSSDGTSKSVTTTNTFDKYRRLTNKTNTFRDLAYSKEISYNKTRVSNVYDSLKITGNDNTTTIGSFGYTYDDLGRIVSELDASTTPVIYKSYVYDMAGRLVRENNSALNKTYTYVYDSVGNVTSKKTHAYTTASTPGTATSTVAFSYDTTHSDRLTSFGGKAITYDQQGCPLTYDGKTYTWTRGKLTKIATGGATLNPGIKAIVTPVSSESWTYTYNGNGQRTEKEYSYLPAIGQIPSYNYTTSSTTKFTYDHSGRLVQESLTENYKNTSSLTTITKYLYDDSGIIGMVYDGTTYYFHRNIQGDVVGVYNSAGTKVVGFTYDAYGNCTVSGDTSLAYRCKIRYRGYYFDTETGLYWVQTRYYNPQWCRWISPDTLDYLDPETSHGLNLYAYCGNDPVNFADPSGHLGVFFTVLLATLAGAAFGAFKGVAKQIYNGGQWNWDASSWDFKEIGKEILLGSATGFAFGLGGVAGGIVKGSFQAITVAGKTLSVAQSVGFLLGTALTGNFVAGFAGYAIQNAGTSEKFNIGSGILEGIGQAGKGLAAFFVGGLFAASGFWKVGKGAKRSPVGLVVRAFTKYLLTMTPNNLLEELF